MSFYCKHYKCKIEMQACVKRQTRRQGEVAIPFDAYCTSGDCTQGYLAIVAVKGRPYAYRWHRAKKGKECPRCGEYKPWHDYSPGTSKGGRQTLCKACIAARARLKKRARRKDTCTHA